MANKLLYSAFERLWKNTVTFVNNKTANTLLYTQQDLTEEQKAQVRANLGITNTNGGSSTPTPPVDSGESVTTEYIYTGSAITPMIEVYDDEILLEKNVHYTVSYINNTNVTSGKKIPTIVVKGKGNYTGTLKEYFSILPKELDETLGITVSAKDVLFNAKTAKSKDGIVTSIIVKDGSKTLKNKTDYKVLGYLNSKECGEKTDIEPPTVVIEGLGNYTGMMEIPYRIYQASVSVLAISKISSQPYTGKEIEPKPIITVKISKTDTITLTENVDYTLSWSNNVKIGKGKITITGIGNYGGTKTVTFTIVPKWLKWF